MNQKSNVIIFGTGAFYNKRKQLLPEQTNIVAFIDNNVSVQGKSLDGVLIYSPQEGIQLQYDSIILASVAASEMKKQLLALGVTESRIMYWEQYVSSKAHGVIRKYEASSCEQSGKKCVILVPFVNFTGGYLTALYTAIALQKSGCRVCIASSTAEKPAIEETNKQGISVWVCPALPYIGEEELEWIEQFDYVWANTLSMMICVDRICKRKSVVWWLHESANMYERTVVQYADEIKDSTFEGAGILAVSTIAKRNFLKYFPDTKVEVFPFGIPDFYVKNQSLQKKVQLAVIGTIASHKNQKEFVQAVKCLPEELKDMVECRIIGRVGEQKYFEELQAMVEELDNVILCGEMTHNQLEKAFAEIDVVVCTSLEETMSITIVEGMMNYKICVTTENAGISDYIEDGRNGFVYSPQDAGGLSEKLADIISDFDKMKPVRNCARESYETYFSMEAFKNRLMAVLDRLK